jgi:maltose alpha-D-glucosyltransferase / alpha-amylase
MVDRTDKHWYRDAIIYQVPVKSFFDSNNDGIGDFRGLTQKLDYVRDLGATALWVMPFYPSPLRDDGYDISDYRGINSSYGRMRDFKTFVREAHYRGLRVITELVINHTSDQHPWFQRARRATHGSGARDFYVWSDTDQRFRDARIIFRDTEISNWTWDPFAKAYFWHRFYSHQPDLNFDNPRVLDAMLDTMRFWLDMGVDGLRLDAIPYLIERDGTSCENLPETHAIVKRLRAALEAAYPDRVLLAEANQWPEDSAQYFGQGDECHMAFHFPLMPRIYISLALEDRHPITDIMRQTPDTPENAQWAIFLRNHDELTLEMVTDEERDYLWSFYAADKRARLNLGIRRRLAPLLENDRRKIELLNSLLLSMPGTPVIYYGDEIGMGDNIYLGDRDGVRTPMQWSPDRNGGFSRTDPARLFLPPIQDPIYGFNSVNVEAQIATPSSLLNWMRRMIAVRRKHKALGRGILHFLYPSNRKVLAYLRRYEEETLLFLANVSHAPQAAELDLAEFRGCAPIELTVGSHFPQVGGLPYMLTLPSYGFYWFRLEKAAERERFGPAPAPELFTLVLTGSAAELLLGREREAFERTIAPRFLVARRWFASKSTGVARVRLRGVAALPSACGMKTFLLAILNVNLRNGATETYFTPLTVDEKAEEKSIEAYAVARVRRGSRLGLLYDADASSEFGIRMLEAFRQERLLSLGVDDRLEFHTTTVFAAEAGVDAGDVRRIGAEQSNSSLVLGEQMVLKLYRRLQQGAGIELEIGRFLAEVNFSNTPTLLGWVEHVAPNGTRTAVAILQRFVENQGDAWLWTLDTLKRELEPAALGEADTPIDQAFATYWPYVELLGRRTAELHSTFASSEDAAFSAEPLTITDLQSVAADAQKQAEDAYSACESLYSMLPEEPRQLVMEFLKRRDEIKAAIDYLGAVAPGNLVKTRVHGDYHLGQVLIANNDVMLIDFEGEPQRPLEERRAKFSPIRDVAGMLLSFSYAANRAVRELSAGLEHHLAETLEHALRWEQRAAEIFVASYGAATQGSVIGAQDVEAQRRLLRLNLFAKVLYEVNYEAGNRPDWIDIPLRGVLGLLSDGAGAAQGRKN